MVVSNSSPLITLARAGQLDLLRQLFGQIHIAEEVRQEVVVRGAGRPAAPPLVVQVRYLRNVQRRSRRRPRWRLNVQPLQRDPRAFLDRQRMLPRSLGAVPGDA